jgi:hypothetical protein
MGMFMIAGSAARIAGPAFAGPALSFANQRVTFGVLLAVWGVGFVLLLIAFTRLDPHPPPEELTDDPAAITSVTADGVVAVLPPDEEETVALTGTGSSGERKLLGAAAAAAHVQGDRGDVYLSYGTLGTGTRERDDVDDV